MVKIEKTGYYWVKGKETDRILKNTQLAYYKPNKIDPEQNRMIELINVPGLSVAKSELTHAQFIPMPRFRRVKDTNGTEICT